MWINFGFRLVMDRFTSGVRVLSVQPISGVGSGMDLAQSIRVSDFESVLPGLAATLRSATVVVMVVEPLYGYSPTTSNRHSGYHFFL